MALGYPAMRPEESPTLPLMSVEHTRLTIAHTPINRVGLVAKPLPQEHIGHIPRDNPYFLQQLREFVDSDIYLKVEPEGIIARVKAEEDELEQASLEIIHCCSEIAISIRSNIDRGLQDVFTLQNQQLLPYAHSLSSLNGALNAVDARKKILDAAKEQIVTAEELRIEGLRQARISAYWRTINSTMRDIVQPATVIADYTLTARTVLERVQNVEQLLFTTRMVHGRYFKTETD